MMVVCRVCLVCLVFAGCVWLRSQSCPAVSMVVFVRAVGRAVVSHQIGRAADRWVLPIGTFER